MQLYLIPPDGGQGGRVPTRRSYHRSRSLSLTPDETRRLRAALRGLKARLGSWRAVSTAMGGVHTRTLAGVACGIGRGSPALVLLAARVAERPHVDSGYTESSRQVALFICETLEATIAKLENLGLDPTLVVGGAFCLIESTTLLPALRIVFDNPHDLSLSPGFRRSAVILFGINGNMLFVYSASDNGDLRPDSERHVVYRQHLSDFIDVVKKDTRRLYDAVRGSLRHIIDDA